MNDAAERFTGKLEVWQNTRFNIACINHALKCLKQRKYLDYQEMKY